VSSVRHRERAVANSDLADDEIGEDQAEVVADRVHDGFGSSVRGGASDYGQEARSATVIGWVKAPARGQSPLSTGRLGRVKPMIVGVHG
jgi:hypothetical protein